jgi:hypothetical protein
MEKDTDSLNLTDRQKTRLLDLALGPPNSAEPRNEDEERGDLLHDMLRCSLPLRTGSPEGRTTSSRGLCPVVGPSIGELLQDPKTGTAVLKEVKQYAKARGNQATSEREKDVFLAIYFAAIAGAWVYRRECITQHADEDMARFLVHYASVEWIPSSLRDLFQSATPSVPEGKKAET